MKRAAAVTLLLCLSAIAFAQGLHWQQQQTGGGQTEIHNFYAVPRKFKSVSANDNRVTIMRLDREVMWMLDTKKKTYQEMTFAQMEQMASAVGGRMQSSPQADEARARMEKEMADMPEEQRKMVEKMMGGKIPGMGDSAPIEVDKTNESRTISGYNCKKYVMRRGDETISTLWVTKDIREFAPYAEDWKEFSRRLGSLQQMAKGMGEAFAKIDGFTVQSNMKIMGIEVTSTLTRLERASPAASEFDIPSGYKKEASDVEKAMRQMEEK
jgi:GLPGLI family protein